MPCTLVWALPQCENNDLMGWGYSKPVSQSYKRIREPQAVIDQGHPNDSLQETDTWQAEDTPMLQYLQA